MTAAFKAKLAKALLKTTSFEFVQKVLQLLNGTPYVEKCFINGKLTKVISEQGYTAVQISNAAIIDFGTYYRIIKIGKNNNVKFIRTVISNESNKERR